MKVTLVGYFGCGNLGDEAILHSLIYQLKTSSNPDIIVLSGNPKQTSNKFKVMALNRKILSEVLAAIQMSDVVVFGGGTLFQDKTSFLSILYYIGLVKLSRILKKPIILHSQGVEPLNYFISKILVKNAFNNSSCISVRDRSSKQYLLNTLKVKKQISYAVDPALIMPPLKKNNRYKNYIGINLLPMEDFPTKQLTEALLRFANLYKIKYLYIPLNDDDVLSGEKLEKELGKNIIECLPVYTILPELIGILSQLLFMIGARLHSLILSSAVYTPFLGLNYHEKVTSFANDVDQNTISTENLTEDLLYNFLCNLYKNNQKLRNQLKFKVEKLIALSKDSFIGNVLRKYDKT